MNLIKVKAGSKVLFIHHWDCDGLCSAALLYKYLSEKNSWLYNVGKVSGLPKSEEKISFMIPQIGNYFLNSRDLKSIASINPAYIFIIDIALPKEDVLKLKIITPYIYIFDHHRQDEVKEVSHINPCSNPEVFKNIKINTNTAVPQKNEAIYLERIGGVPAYPSTGWVINCYFKRGQNTLSVLGAVGDQETGIKNNIEALEVINSSGVSFKNFLEMAKQIDSNYIIENRNKLHELVRIMIEKGDHAPTLVKELKSYDNRLKIEEEINSAVSAISLKDKKNKIILNRFKSCDHIISQVARRISNRHPDYLVIVVNESDKNSSNIYVRRKNIRFNLALIIDFARLRKYNAGGKDEVVGIILPKKNVNIFLEELIDYLKSII